MIMPESIWNVIRSTMCGASFKSARLRRKTLSTRSSCLAVAGQVPGASHKRDRTCWKAVIHLCGSTKKHPRNVYASTREECEEKLKALIIEMKTELAELKRQNTEGALPPQETEKGKKKAKKNK